MKNLVVTILMATSVIAFAQDKKETKKSFFKKEKHAITASVAHTKDIPLFSAIGIPNIFSNPIRPWYAIGIEKMYRQRKTYNMYYGAELNYHDYKYVDRSVGLTFIGGFNKTIYKGLYVGLGMGIGFQKAKRADIIYTYEGNEWVGSVYPGKWQYNRQNFRFSAELGYKFKKQNLSAYLGANTMILRNPYGQDVPLGLYQTPIKIGVRKFLK
jgi:hypothetical protein